jgi:hypothetical protein
MRWTISQFFLTIRFGRRDVPRTLYLESVGFRAMRFTATGFVCMIALAAQPAADPVYKERVVPFLAKNCGSCHNEKVRMGNVSLADPGRDTTIWSKVHERLSTGRMPPPGSPRPDASDTAFVLAWMEPLTKHSRAAADAGRVTSRRLNREEYNNTIRDLLGIATRPADEFPLDDAGYGFDTVGDVQSVSPMLMEKYIAAARRLSKLAVYGEPVPAKPTKLVRFMTKKSQDDPTPGVLPFSNRGAIYGSFSFPVSGEYELRMRVGNYRPRVNQTPRQRDLSRKRGLSEAEKQELDALNRQAYPPVRMVLTLDGRQILTEVVEGNIDFQYAHGESIARVKVDAGVHHFRASFPAFANLENPLDNMNTDGRRKLFIDYLDIVGPFNPAVSRSELQRMLFACDEQTPACAEKMVGALARRAYRRAVTPEEVNRLAGLVAQVRSRGDSFAEGIRVALEAVLLSPHFLFRPEPAARREEPVSDYDLASRLSYFLWSSMPDETLLRAAGQGVLRQPAVLRAQVQRMLEDPKADALVENFAGQWLSLRILDKRKPDPKQFPRVDDELLDAMRRETTLFTKAILQENRSILEFLDGRSMFVNGPLARHYGIAGVDGEEFQHVQPKDGRRGGVITQGAVLTLSSYATRTSPVLRGRWVLETLLGTPPPPPPADVPALPEGTHANTASLRQRLEQHRENPNCAVCHDLMDPIGFGLENFDAAGAWREKDGGFPIDNSGRLSSGETFRGPEELRRVLTKQSSMFARNFVEKLITYALGRGLEPGDAPEVDRILKVTAADGYRARTLIQEIINSRVFLMRGKSNGDTLASR